MASQFYNRYVPPANGAGAVSKHRSPAETSNATPLGKRKRGNDSQPKPEKVESQGEDDELTQKQTRNTVVAKRAKDKNDKRKELESTSQRKTPNPETALVNGEAAKTKKPKKEKKDKLKSQTQSQVAVTDFNEVEQQENLDEGAAKHKNILTKFKQAKSVSAASQSRQDQNPPVNTDQEVSDKVEKHGLTPLPQPEEAPEDDAPVVSGLPDWLAKPVRVPSSESRSFLSLGLGEDTAKILQAAGYDDALPVQSAVIPLLPQRTDHFASDLCISASTGSGKTLAYTLPILEDLKGRPTTKLRAVIVVPTRELVAQVRSSFQLCGAENKIRVGTASGDKALKEEQKLLVERSVNYDPEAYNGRKNKDIEDVEEELLDDVLDMDRELAQMALTPDFVIQYESKVDALICTPGRLVEHLRCTKGFSLESARWLVIDEADRLLDQSFQEWTECVIPAIHVEPEVSPMLQQYRTMAQLVTRKRIRKVVLSATMTKDVGKLAGLRLHRPKLVVVESTAHQADGHVNGDQSGNKANAEDSSLELPERLEEMAIPVKRDGEKPLYLVELIKDQIKLEQSPESTTFKHVHDDDLDTSSEGSSEGDSNDSSTLSATETTSEAKAEGNRGMLVFTNSNESALRLARLLTILQPSWSSKIQSLTKSAGTSSGRKAINALTKGRISVLVASDRASRGLDLPDLAHVVSYDMPASLTSYVHRVGRTARANKNGLATTLVGFHEAKWFWHEIARTEKVKRQRKVSRDDGFFRRISKAMAEDLESALEQLGREAIGEK